MDINSQNTYFEYLRDYIQRMENTLKRYQKKIGIVPEEEENFENMTVGDVSIEKLIAEPELGCRLFAEYDRQLNESGQALNHMKGSLDSLQSKHENLKQTKNRKMKLLESRIQQLEAESIRLSRNQPKINRKLEQSHQVIDNLEDENLDLKKQLRSRGEDLERMREAFDRLQQREEVPGRDKSRSKNEPDEENKVKILTTQNQALQEEINSLRSCEMKSLHSTSVLSEQFNEMKRKYEILKKSEARLRKWRTESEEANNQRIEKYKARIERIRRQSNQKRNLDLEQLCLKIENLEVNNCRLRAKMKKLKFERDMKFEALKLSRKTQNQDPIQTKSEEDLLLMHHNYVKPSFFDDLDTPEQAEPFRFRRDQILELKQMKENENLQTANRLEQKKNETIINQLNLRTLEQDRMIRKLERRNSHLEDEISRLKVSPERNDEQKFFEKKLRSEKEEQRKSMQKELERRLRMERSQMKRQYELKIIALEEELKNKRKETSSLRQSRDGLVQARREAESQALEQRERLKDEYEDLDRKHRVTKRELKRIETKRYNSTLPLKFLKNDFSLQKSFDGMDVIRRKNGSYLSKSLQMPQDSLRKSWDLNNSVTKRRRRRKKY